MLNWIFFAILARFVWAGTNILDKIIVTHHIPNPFSYVIFTGLFGFITGLIIFIISGLAPISPSSIFLASLGGILYIYCIVPYLQAMKHDEASRITALFATTPLFVLLLNFFFTGESLALFDFIALILLVIGGFSISVRRIDNTFRINQSFWWVIISMIIFALSSVLLSFAYQENDYLTVFTIARFAGGLSIIPFFFISSIRNSFTKVITQSSKKVIAIIGFNELLTVSGVASIEYAFKTGNVSLVSALGSTQALFVLVLAIFFSVKFPWLLKEEVSRNTILLKLFAITLIAISIYLITI